MKKYCAVVYVNFTADDDKAAEVMENFLIESIQQIDGIGEVEVADVLEMEVE